MDNTCGNEDSNDPINSYIKNCKLDIDNVPIDIIRKSASLYDHRIEDDYIYGVKLVSKNYKHMFAKESDPSYEKDGVYHYDDASNEGSKFNNCCYPHKWGVHGAGLWAFPCVEKSVAFDEKQTLCVPILVRFPLKSTIVLGNYAIKGKIMEVVSLDRNDVEKYLK